MHWTRRIYVVVSVILALVISGCFGGSSSLTVDWSTVDIEISDHYDIPVGTYTIPFSIDEIVELAADYEVDVIWSITRSDEQPVVHTSNQFTVEAGAVYTASITVTIENNLYTYHKEITLEAISEMMSITWDYNFESGTQSEITTHPINSVITPITAPNQSGYVFEGWYASLSDTTPFDFSTVIPTNRTFYAKWEISVEASLHTEYFTYVELVNGSSIHDGHPFQHMTLQSTLLYDDNNLPEEVDEYGMIYSESPTLTWGNEDVKTSELGDYWLDHMGYIHHQSTSLALDDLSTYYARPYVRYDHTVYFGEMVSYSTDQLVPSGQSEGLLSHVSGGHYYYDYGSTQYSSGVFIEFDDAFTAELNGHSLSNFERIMNQGYLHLVTIDLTDDSRHLHVIEIKHRTSPAVVTYDSEVFSNTFIENIERTTIQVSYNSHYVSGELWAYDFDHAGVLYSTTHPFLTRDQIDVTKIISTSIDDVGAFTSDEAYIIPANAERIYTRGYVIEDDRVSYSDRVEVFEKGFQGWTKLGSYTWDTMNLKPTASHQIFTSASAVTRVTTLATEITSEDFTGSFNVTGPGIKYITTPESSFLSIQELIFDHDLLTVTGVEDGMTYDHPVTIDFVDWNVEAYLQIGDTETNFASGVTISNSGNYTLSLYHVSGDVTISFSIT